MNKLTECKKIYEQAFGCDDLEFENLLFEKCFKYLKTYAMDNSICAMLFALPTTIETIDGCMDAVYIYAAATREDLRGRGYMTKLINEVLKESSKTAFLRPANDGLVTYYERLGFRVLTAYKKESGLPRAIPTEDFLSLTESLNLKADGSGYTAMYYPCSESELKSLSFIYSME